MTQEAPHAGLMNVTVPVPVERVGDFYRMFARWMGGSVEEVALPEHWRPEHWRPGLAAHTDADAPERHRWRADNEDDLAAATEVWARLSSGARTLLKELLKDPEREVSVDDLAASLGTDRAVITGTLSWPVRIARKKGFPAPIVVRKVPDGIYCKLDRRAAAVLARLVEADDV